MDQHGTPDPLLLLERQILQEAEVTTLPRGGGKLPSLKYHPEGHEQCLTFLRSSDQWTIKGSDRGNDGWSPANVLVDTVARMQQDLSDLRTENRLLRTPEVPAVVRTSRQAAFTMTKVARFGGTTSWEQYRQVFDDIVLSDGWDNETAALQLPFGG